MNVKGKHWAAIKADIWKFVKNPVGDLKEHKQYDSVLSAPPP